MLKTSLLMLLLLSSDEFRIVGTVASSAKGGRATLESADGRRVKASDIGRDGKFQFKNVPEGRYFVIVAMDKGRDMRRSLEVSKRSADKDGRISFSIDMQDVMHASDRASISAESLSISSAATDEYRRSLAVGLPLDEVRGHLELAIAAAPRFDEALNDLGAVYFRQGNSARAIELFERAVEANPKSFFAHVNLGGAFLESKEYERALMENLRAIELRPEDSLAHAQAGVALFNLHRYSEAFPHLTESKRLDPLIPIAPGLYMAEIYDNIGLADKAILEYNQFLNDYPDHASSYFVKSRVRSLSSKRQAPAGTEEFR